MGGWHKAAAITAAAGLIIIISVFPVAVVADPPDPDPFEIGTPAVFQDIFVTDDFLLLMPYEIMQYPQMEVPIGQQFFFRLIDTDGETQLAAAMPYAFYNIGYGKGIVSFYFDADDAPDWGESYNLRIDCNPLYFSDSLSTSRDLNPGDYSSLSNQPLALADYILTQAAILEINWGVKLYDTSSTGIILTATGQTYFATTIPGLDQVCPSIMAASVADPNWDDTPQGHSAADSWSSQWDDTKVKILLEEAGNKLGIAWNAVSGGILFGLMLLCAGMSQARWGNGDPGFVAGNVILVVGTFAGWVFWAIVMVEAIILGWWIGHNIFWKQG